MNAQNKVKFSENNTLNPTQFMKKSIVNMKPVNEFLQASYERMMAYELASGATTNAALKYFFENKANETERQTDELAKLLPGLVLHSKHTHNILPATALFERCMHRKPVHFIIDCSRQIEKNMLHVCNVILKEMNTLPESFVRFIKKIQKNIIETEMQLSQL